MIACSSCQLNHCITDLEPLRFIPWQRAPFSVLALGASNLSYASEWKCVLEVIWPCQFYCHKRIWASSLRFPDIDQLPLIFISVRFCRLKNTKSTLGLSYPLNGVRTNVKEPKLFIYAAIAQKNQEIQEKFESQKFPIIA